MTADEPSLFWIEPATITELLERVERDVPRRSAEPAAPGDSDLSEVTHPFSAAPQPAAPQPAAPQPAAPQLAAPQPAADLPALRVQPVAFAEAEIPEGSPIEQRLGALLDWLGQQIEPEQAFVTGDDGLALVETRATPDVVAAVAVLGKTWDSLHGTLGAPEDSALGVDLAGGRRLVVCMAQTSWGPLQLGYVTARPLARELRDTIRETFLRTVLAERDA